MKQYGFEYVSVPAMTDLSLSLVKFVARPPVDVAAAEATGFGLADLYEAAKAELSIEEQMQNSPNVKITNALSAAELDEYLIALFGTSDEFSDGDVIDDSAGCAGQVSPRVNRSNLFFDEFEDELAEFWTDLRSDPVVVEALASWTSCMGANGHEVEVPSNAAQDLEQHLASSEIVRLPGSRPVTISKH